MKVCTKCKIEKPTTSFHKDCNNPSGLKPHCKDCRKLSRKKHRKENHKRLLQKERDRRLQNKEKLKEYNKNYHREYYKRNREKTLERNRNWKFNNPDRLRQMWAKNASDRRARLLNATPKWLTQKDLEYIKELFKVAQELTIQTGVPHQVDHIHPLRGRNVWGLHCPDNLQVIPAIENQRKSNKFEP